MLFLELLIVAYLIVVILAVLMVFSTIDDGTLRTLFLFLGLIMPLIVLYAAVTSLFIRRPMPPFNEEFAKTEDDIENERVKIFGGDRVEPSFGDRWRKMYLDYLERLFANVSKTSKKIAEISTTFRHAA